MDLISSTTVESFHNDNSHTITMNANQNTEENPPETDPNENSSANSSFNKMECLLVEEDDEDVLGTESLRMSGSDDDGDNISPVRRKKRPTQQIVDSDEDDEGKEGNVDNDNNEEVKENEISHKPKKFSALIDSDSEPEETIDEVIEKPNSPKISEDESEADERSVKETKQKKKKNKQEKSKKKKKDPKPITSDSENEEESTKPSKSKTKVSDLVDSDSESSNASSDHEEENQENKKPPAPRQKKPQRASAKKAMDEMQAIQSETQRLYRETEVNIPYHKPKRHTLKEFLTRRTIVKPSLNQLGPGKSLKMSPEELEEYAKQLEERAKEATEFFKSESEDELKDVEENESTDKNPSVEPMETSISETNINNESEAPAEAVQPDATQPLNTEEIDQILKEHEFISQPSTEELLNDLQSESEPQPSTSASTSNGLLNEQENKASPSAARPSALAELKRRLIADKSIPLVPKLKGDANMMIDFETGDMFARKPTGVENLFQRFIKSNKNNKRKPEETTPSQELQTTLKVAVIQESNKEKEPKPGAAYMKLKENLRTLISRKRKEEFRKKIEETKEEEDEYNKCCGLDDEEFDEEDKKEERESKSKSRKSQHDIVIDEEENEIDLEEYENDEDEEENQDTEIAEENTKGEENEEEPEAAEDDNEEEKQDDDENKSDSSSSDEEEQENNEDPSMRKHRVIKAFEDSDDEVNPGLNETSTSVLYAEEENKNPVEVENELLDLCSGQFAATQAATLISQIPITQTPGNVNETELEELCSGVFNEGNTQINGTQIQETQVEKTQKTVTRILSSDEEKEPDEEVSKSEAKKVKKLRKKKKKHMKLGFSDDEDDEAEEELISAEESEEEEEIPQTFIDYDSEENEIEVQMSKKDCLKQANTFLEKEAELSESEWGSADEDEQNLDKYDQELGDEDEFDQQKLHTELEQIHMRKVLDDDIREVKKIQEMLFDDEEADGVGRQRKFRWKNVESGFSLDDPAGGGADNDDQVDSADDEEEMKWRKMRFEREQFLMQRTTEEILADVSKTELGKKLIDTMVEPKLNYVIENEVIVEKEYKKPSFLIKQNDLSKMRNSVLNYDKDILAKIAESITKSGDYERTDNEQVQQKASKTGNFVFAPLTEEEKEMRKRKAEEEKMGNAPKKMKTCTNKSLFLDGLL
ncbi:claspin [Episyrphus balteatus]|uniref:claspin n=1 Tax=Episyrphus balteatus TaxID=286459 RepID=UPI0024856C58|nr:claspin [Episyrphus balteatus]